MQTVCSAVFIKVYVFPAGDRLPYSQIYHLMSFKDPKAKVFLSSPITAKIMEVERFTLAQDRFNKTTQRSVNKVSAAWVGVIRPELHGLKCWLTGASAAVDPVSV